MRTRNKHKQQQASHTQDFPALFLCIEHEEEETVRVTESRYHLSATGKDKEEALGAFWQLVEIETYWDVTKDMEERIELEYFRSILAQEKAFERQEVKETVEV